MNFKIQTCYFKVEQFDHRTPEPPRPAGRVQMYPDRTRKGLGVFVVQ